MKLGQSAAASHVAFAHHELVYVSQITSLGLHSPSSVQFQSL
jgi:hypothetical protein